MCVNICICIKSICVNICIYMHKKNEKILKDIVRKHIKSVNDKDEIHLNI